MSGIIPQDGMGAKSGCGAWEPGLTVNGFGERIQRMSRSRAPNPLNPFASSADSFSGLSRTPAKVRRTPLMRSLEHTTLCYPEERNAPASLAMLAGGTTTPPLHHSTTHFPYTMGLERWPRPGGDRGGRCRRRRGRRRGRGAPFDILLVVWYSRRVRNPDNAADPPRSAARADSQQWRRQAATAS